MYLNVAIFLFQKDPSDRVPVENVYCKLIKDLQRVQYKMGSRLDTGIRENNVFGSLPIIRFSLTTSQYTVMPGGGIFDLHQCLKNEDTSADLLESSI